MYVRQITVKHKKGSAGAALMSRQRDQDGGGSETITVREVPQFKVENFVLMAEFDDGDESYRQKAENELRETPEVVQQALKDIRVLVQGEPNFAVPDDDEFFQKFLRPCKWYPKSAFQLMTRFYRFRVNNPQYCADLVPSTEKKALLSEMVIPLPERTTQGRRVLLVHLGKRWNPKVITINDTFRAVALSLEAAMAEPKTQIAGVHVIIDLNGFSVSHATHITPSFAMALTEFVQKCLPCRLKGIHLVNNPFIFNMVFALFKPFLSEKMRKRIIFHGTDKKSLMSHVSANCIPTEFGGDFEIPKVPLGQGIYEYFYWFEKDFEIANKYGYSAQAKS
ncbi:alpha-tocopherol transfer protein isoform X2 [Nomia melanderi]|uniref:alpha-tocopherol transfer protein isoform X2 n=1 Tax=Nomia melanderi TaxID=2448451 RepID=UPI0013042349|nr:alpha-tocopherol transfer protein-like isoform X2 [Nomia melanderi]XP_031849817.1 alpha-tocopherol transfer protein-like isoform X2 [Nomia melanderi]XP_031849818.1 alpha-tocopherol transfer protein-like isoform X2 [Nomia melanderi]XP_031849819.1 alpha-tocopherol transfer protein-like isoform X2 [Nomia melanderi]XP_031849820.1 alpha-tocopherol transfer protein-like isoform X2 [Nomia melanderi]